MAATEYIEVEPYGDATLTVTTYSLSIALPSGGTATGDRAYAEVGPPTVAAARLEIAADGTASLQTRSL